MSLNTLQERIEWKAQQRANTDATALMEKIRYLIGDTRMYVKDFNDGTAKIDGYVLQQSLLDMFKKRLFKDYVNEESDKLLKTVEELGYLQETVENIQRGA